MSAPRRSQRQGGRRYETPVARIPRSLTIDFRAPDCCTTGIIAVGPPRSPQRRAEVRTQGSGGPCSGRFAVAPGRSKSCLRRSSKSVPEAFPARRFSEPPPDNSFQIRCIGGFESPVARTPETVKVLKVSTTPRHPTPPLPQDTVPSRCA